MGVHGVVEVIAHGADGLFLRAHRYDANPDGTLVLVLTHANGARTTRHLSTQMLTFADMETWEPVLEALLPRAPRVRVVYSLEDPGSGTSATLNAGALRAHRTPFGT